MDVVILGLRDVISGGLTLFTWAVIIRAILSWFRPDPYHPAVRILVRFTDPVLLPIQRFMPDLGGLDLSPIVAIFGAQIVQSVVGQLLTRIAYSFT
ncbi:MAG: YggT family protein [bacterium]|nr:YggT family protein [bacterium]